MCRESLGALTKELIQIVLHRSPCKQDPPLASQGQKGGHGLAALGSLQPAQHLPLQCSAAQLTVLCGVSSCAAI